MPYLRLVVLVEASSSLIAGQRIEAAVRGAVAALGAGVVDLVSAPARGTAADDARRQRAPTRPMRRIRPKD